MNNLNIIYGSYYSGYGLPPQINTPSAFKKKETKIRIFWFSYNGPIGSIIESSSISEIFRNFSALLMKYHNLQ